MTDECYRQVDIGLNHLLYRDYDTALQHFQEALKLDNKSPEIHYNIGQCYFGLNRIEDAIEAYKQAAKLRMDYSEAWAMLGTCHYSLLEVNQAISCYKMAADMAKTEKFKTDCLNDMSSVYFAMGKYDIGHKYFKYRHVPDTWDGTQSLVGKTLYVIGDGGLGDQIFFSRYLPWVSDLNYEKLIVRVSPDILSWFKAEFLESGNNAKLTDEKPEHYDYLVSMSSLPKIFNTQAGAVPIIWSNKLAWTNTRNIGLAWSGNPLHANDKQRSMPVTQINKIIDAFPNKTFYKFQKHVPYADKDYVHKRLIDMPYDDVLSMSQMMTHYNIDLVITVDTMTAHVACTEGFNTCIMLPYAPDWRWGLTGDTTVWYPTAKLFRQGVDRSWNSVISDIIEQVRKW